MTTMLRCGLLALAVLGLLGPASGLTAASPEERVSTLDLPPQAEKAINSGLAFIGRSQNQDGSWGDHYFVTHTAMALLAFMVQGHVPGEGAYGRQMEQGIDYLVVRSRANNGYIVDSSSATMYQHCYATMALAEAWGQSKRPELRGVLKQAVDILLRSQDPQKGCWNYNPRPGGGDLSITVAAVQALVSAKEAGILVPDRSLQLAIDFCKRVQDPIEGWFGYHSASGDPTIYRDGAGVLSLMLMGDHDSNHLQRGIMRLRKVPEEAFRTTHYYFMAHFYCVQACYQAGDQDIQSWYPQIANEIIKQQRNDGSWEGSDGGKVHPSFNAAVSVLILGVPYRFLPIYQR